MLLLKKEFNREGVECKSSLAEKSQGKERKESRIFNKKSEKVK